MPETQKDASNKYSVWVRIREEARGAINSLRHSLALELRGHFFCSYDAISLFMCITAISFLPVESYTVGWIEIHSAVFF